MIDYVNTAEGILKVIPNIDSETLVGILKAIIEKEESKISYSSPYTIYTTGDYGVLKG